MSGQTSPARSCVPAGEQRGYPTAVMHDDDDLRDLDPRRRPAFRLIVIVIVIGLLLFIAPLFFDLLIR